MYPAINHPPKENVGLSCRHGMTPGMREIFPLHNLEFPVIEGAPLATDRPAFLTEAAIRRPVGKAACWGIV